MTWWNRRRTVDSLKDVISALRSELQRARHDGERARLELALVGQARDRAERDATYWRERAEKFIDQIGVKSAMLTVPTMTGAPTSPTDSQFTTVFAALGSTEINSEQRPHQSAASTAAPVVTGVDPQVASAAVRDLLARV